LGFVPRPNLHSSSIDIIMTDDLPGQYRHFLTYSGVKLPFKLLTPLEPEQIENRNTFFRGYFDAEERLIGLQKIVYGEVELEHRYAYDGHGTLRRAEITDVDGEVTVLDFDETGQPLQV
jgi:hypothetical protein